MMSSSQMWSQAEPEVCGYETGEEVDLCEAESYQSGWCGYNTGDELEEETLETGFDSFDDAASEKVGSQGGETASTCAPSHSEDLAEHADLELPLPRAKGRKRRGNMRMAECLKELDHCEPERVLRISRVGRLGPDGSELLQRHLERCFGAVEQMHFVHPPLEGCKRPSNMVFVVMASTYAAQCVLSLGEDLLVLPGVSVQVKQYRPRAD